MKKYQDNDFGLTINRTKLEDAGEYVVRAKNSYGSKEEVVFLQVHSKYLAHRLCGSESKGLSYRLSEQPEAEPAPKIEEPRPRQKLSPLPALTPWEEPDTPPKFTFHLRPRLIQVNHACKLICCVAGKPTPTVRMSLPKAKQGLKQGSLQVTFFKDGREVNQDRVQVNVKHGVCSLEIYNVRMEDAGKYSCVAENSLGSEETSCILSVQGKRLMRNAYSGPI